MLHAICTQFIIRLGFVFRLTTLSYLSSMNPFKRENKYRSYVPWGWLYSCQIEIRRFKKTVQKRSNVVVGETSTCEMIFPSMKNWQTSPKLVSRPDDNQLIKLKSKRQFQSWRIFISHEISQLPKVVASQPEVLEDCSTAVTISFRWMEQTVWSIRPVGAGWLKYVFGIRDKN